jgi:nicotinamide mononucleotide transporter
MAIWLTAKVHILCWSLNILSSLIYLYVFFKARLYADGALQFVFIALSILAWINWDNNPKGLPLVTRKIKARELWIGIGVCLIMSVFAGLFLKYFTNDSLPFPDGICFVTSVWATYLTAYFILENWIIWIFTNLFYILIYIEKGLYPTTLLYFILCILAVLGYREWKKCLIPL